MTHILALITGLALGVTATLWFSIHMSGGLEAKYRCQFESGYQCGLNGWVPTDLKVEP